MDEEKRFIKKYLSSEKAEDFASSLDISFAPKDIEISIQCRTEGNQIFLQKNHTADEHGKILFFYNRCIASAPDKSEEMEYGYSNRSAYLLHLKKYKHCLADIERVLTFTQSNALKVKLYCRKTECLTALGLLSNKDAFEIAVKCFGNIGRNHKEEKLLAQMVTKAKRILDDNKCEKIKNININKHSKVEDVLSQREKDGLLNCVEIKDSKIWGKGLFATRNIKPGEILFVEKPFALCPNIAKPYIYCCHCLAVAWNGIPCETCSWSIFCSDKCKNEAWQKYHDIECSIISHLIQLGESYVYQSHMCIRIIIMVLKEFRGVDQLKNELTKNHNLICSKNETKGFSKCEDFGSRLFRNVYSLSDTVSKKHLEALVELSGQVLICISKFTSLFPIKLTESLSLLDFIQNEDFLYVGSLFLKIMKINCVKGYSICNGSQVETLSQDLFKEAMNDLNDRGFCLASFSSLINNSCIPNVRRCFTKDMNLMFYAMEPISAGNQIFDSFLCSFYETPDSINRKSVLKQHFYLDCNCIACERDWPPVLTAPIDDLERYKRAPSFHREILLASEYQEVIQHVHKNKKYDDRILNTLISGIEKSALLLSQPSTLRCMLMVSLQMVIEQFYGYDKNIFDKC